jgi:hypothetical protein
MGNLLQEQNPIDTTDEELVLATYQESNNNNNNKDKVSDEYIIAVTGRDYLASLME